MEQRPSRPTTPVVKAPSSATAGYGGNWVADIGTWLISSPVGLDEYIVPL